MDIPLEVAVGTGSADMVPEVVAVISGVDSAAESGTVFSSVDILPEAGVLICHAQALKHWAEALAGIFVPHPLNAAPAPGLSSYVPSLNIPLRTRSLSQPKEDWWVTQEGGTPPPAALCPHGSSAPLATLQEALFFRGWV